MTAIPIQNRFTTEGSAGTNLSQGWLVIGAMAAGLNPT